MADPKRLIRLVVTFTRAGHTIERETAASGLTALKIALLMIARLDALEVGDRLDVLADMNAIPLPPPRGRQP